MPNYELIIIGAGLSGLAAGIRAARFGVQTLIVEQHHSPGGLNSYYRRQGHLFETGLHAMTNFAPAKDKRAPLNLLFRQLHLSRRDFPVREQIGSEIIFPAGSLSFSNDPALLDVEITRLFPQASEAFRRLRKAIANYDPFTPAPWRSARHFIQDYLHEPLLENMLLLPLMVYGNAEENDMDLGQFVIMFRAIFEDGLFRPQTNMNDFLNLLVQQFEEFGGQLRYNAAVEKKLFRGTHAQAVCLADGTRLATKKIISTAGIPETIRLSGWQTPSTEHRGKMSFTETISLLPKEIADSLRQDRTILFYSESNSPQYKRPDMLQDTSWGVICFPDNFAEKELKAFFSVRVTNSASYPLWHSLEKDVYVERKKACRKEAVAVSEKYIGPYQDAVVYEDSFTPLTIERFTRKAEGAVYGSPLKIHDGITPWANLFIAGTDQGYLGIVGSMLSGISMVNKHILV